MTGPTPEELGRSLEDLAGARSRPRRRPGREQPALDDSSLERIDAARRLVDQISQTSTLSDDQATDFRELSAAALQDSLRQVAARGPEAARTINITVAGTGTISVD